MLNARVFWIKYIPPKNWTPAETSVVCIKHFSAECIITSYQYDYKGQPHLKPNSFPTLFPVLSQYFLSRKSTSEERNLEIEQRNLENQYQLEEVRQKKDTIENFNVLLKNAAKFIQNLAQMFLLR